VTDHQITLLQFRQRNVFSNDIDTVTGGTGEPSILSGPTCDSIDIVAEDIPLPKLQEGDLVIGHMMGAYTAATSTRFNSLDTARIVVVD
jgi:ornithine decarboxylase